MPRTGQKWAAQSEAYAALVAEHLHSRTGWLDVGCGWRLLEADLEPLEDWLVQQCETVVGMDVSLRTHRNISRLVGGSIYALPFSDCSLDLITCGMVMEHLDNPMSALAEIARCLKPGGAVIINTPNLMNYGVMANAIASKVMPQEWRLRLVQASDSRDEDDIFPARYRANSLRRLTQLLTRCGLQIHKAMGLRQQGPFIAKTAQVERFLMKLTPNSRLLVCAHKSN
jgi:SAM-dependent methyltransferase